MKGTKEQVRVLGVDDAPFRFSDGTVLVIGVVVRLPSYVEAVMRTSVKVDGADATAQLEALVRRSRYREQLKAVLLDGIALGGFNIVDLDALHRALRIPVITVTRDRPDLAKIRAALEKYFPDAQERYRTLSQHPLHAVRTAHQPIYVSTVGMPLPQAAELLTLATVRGAIPEPLRLAHLIARGVVRGESAGRA